MTTDPGVAVDPRNGNVYAVFESAPVGSETAHVFFISSTDDGATWSEAVDTRAGGTAAAGHHPGRTQQAGHLTLS